MDKSGIKRGTMLGKVFNRCEKSNNPHFADYGLIFVSLRGDLSQCVGNKLIMLIISETIRIKQLK